MSDNDNLQEKAQQLHDLAEELSGQGRYDLLLDAIGLKTVEQLRIEAARRDLSPLLITEDYRFILTKYDREVELSPIHKALYMLFLEHEDGIEFKRLSDYRDELRSIYTKVTNRVNNDTIEETLTRLTNPLDNAINEKCSRIKTAFAEIVDHYALRHYIITGHSVRHVEDSARQWYERRKIITLPRRLVLGPTTLNH